MVVNMHENERREQLRIQKVYAERERLMAAAKHTPKNPGNLSMQQERDSHLFSWLQRSGYFPLEDKKILDVGCGRGYALRNFVGRGARPENLFGVDLIPMYVEEARRILPGAKLEVANGTKLSYPDESFDLVQQLTVFSSILCEETRRKVALEMLRVLKTGGHVIWYDFFLNNPWNPDVRGVGRREIYELFPHCDYYFERVTVVPPLARMIGQIIPQAYNPLSKLRVLSTHYIAYFRKLGSV